MRNSGVVIGVLSLVCCAAIVSASSSVKVSIATDSAVSHTDPGFVSWTLDSSSNRGFFWRNLSNPEILYLAKNNPPGYLRFGGSGNNDLYYGVEDNCAGQAASKLSECLNATMFDGLISVVQAAETRLVFGLNLLFRTQPNETYPVGVFDPSNAEALMDYAKSKDYTFYGFELGNELNEKFTPERTALDFGILNDVLIRRFPDESTRPKIFGPDLHGFHDVPPDTSKMTWLGHWVGNMTANKTPFHAVTHHEYIETSTDLSLNATHLDLTGGIAAVVNKTVREAAGDYTSYMLAAGEIGPHNGGSPGCQDDTTGRWIHFGDSFWYADAMASKARNGYQLFERQDFVGIDYALIGCRSSTPYSDYYLSQLFRKTMGTGVLAATPSGPDSFRAYAHCSTDANSGDVTVLMLNLSNDTVSADVGLSGSSVSMFQMSGQRRALTPHLNGNLLTYTPFNLPELTPVHQSVGPISLPGPSITFATFTGANAKACS